MTQQRNAFLEFLNSVFERAGQGQLARSQAARANPFADFVPGREARADLEDRRWLERNAMLTDEEVAAIVAQERPTIPPLNLAQTRPAQALLRGLDIADLAVFAPPRQQVTKGFTPQHGVMVNPATGEPIFVDPRVTEAAISPTLAETNFPILQFGRPTETTRQIREETPLPLDILSDLLNPLNLVPFTAPVRTLGRGVVATTRAAIPSVGQRAAEAAARKAAAAAARETADVARGAAERQLIEGRIAAGQVPPIRAAEEATSALAARPAAAELPVTPPARPAAGPAPTLAGGIGRTQATGLSPEQAGDLGQSLRDIEARRVAASEDLAERGRQAREAIEIRARELDAAARTPEEVERLLETGAIRASEVGRDSALDLRRQTLNKYFWEPVAADIVRAAGSDDPQSIADFFTRTLNLPHIQVVDRFEEVPGAVGRIYDKFEMGGQAIVMSDGSLRIALPPESTFMSKAERIIFLRHEIQHHIDRAKGFNLQVDTPFDAQGNIREGHFKDFRAFETDFVSDVLAGRADLITGALRPARGAPPAAARPAPAARVSAAERDWLEDWAVDFGRGPEVDIAGEEHYRVVWGAKSGDTLKTNRLDNVGYSDGPATMRGIHVGDPDFWSKQLAEDYGLDPADARTITIRSIEGDALLSDPQYAIPPQVGEKGDSWVLATKRTQLEYGKDWVFEGEDFAPTPARPAVPAAPPARPAVPDAPGAAVAPEAPLAGEPDILTRAFDNIGLMDENARIAERFVEDTIRPAFVERFGHAPLVMRIINRGGKLALSISEAGWDARATQLGLRRLRWDEFPVPRPHGVDPGPLSPYYDLGPSAPQGQIARPAAIDAPVAEAATGSRVFHGTRSGDVSQFVNAQGDLVLRPSENFGGRQVGVSFAPDRATAEDFATRISGVEGGIAGIRQRGGIVFEIDQDAIPNRLFQEAADEVATRGDDVVVIPKGRFRAVPIDESAQIGVRAFEQAGVEGVGRLTNRELGRRVLRDIIDGEIAEAAGVGGQPLAQIGLGQRLLPGQAEILEQFGSLDPLQPFLTDELNRRLAAAGPTGRARLLQELASGAEDLPARARNAPFLDQPLEANFLPAGEALPVAPVAEAAASSEGTRLAQKWLAAKARNSARAAKDLDGLAAKGYDTDAARAALQEYRDTVRGDFDDASDFADARSEAWDDFVAALDDIEPPAAAAIESPPPPRAAVPEAPGGISLDTRSVRGEGFVPDTASGRAFDVSEGVTFRGFHGTFEEGLPSRLAEARPFDFGGLHAGTDVAAAQRVESIRPSARSGLPGGEQILPVEIRIRQALGSLENPVDETTLFLINGVPSIRQRVLDAGFDGIIYRNIAEDPGSISVVTLRPSADSITFGRAAPPPRAAAPPPAPVAEAVQQQARAEADLTTIFETPPTQQASRAGQPGGQSQRLPPPQVVSSSAEAQAHIAQEAFDPVVGSPLDEAATSYWRTGDFGEYIARSGSPDDPFPVLPGFAESDFNEVGRVSGVFADPTRLLEAIDQGVFGKALQRAILWPTRRTLLASLRFGDDLKGTFEAVLQRHGMLGIRSRGLRNRAGDVLEEIGSQDVAVPVAQLLKRPKIKALVGQLAPARQARVVGFAQDTRRFFDDILDMQNKARLTRGQDEIPKLENYRPWVRETNIWAKLGFSKQPMKDISTGPLPPDFIKPNAPFNPRAVARQGGLAGYEKVRDLQRLAVDYVDTASKDIFYTGIVQNAKAHIRVLRQKGGLENAAAGIEDWIMEAYAGQLPAISQAVRGIIPPPGIKAAFAVRKGLTRAVFPFNWTWNIFVQTSSIALTVHRYGIQDTLRGLSYLASPTVRRTVKDNAYSAIVKSRRGGRYAQQDIDSGIQRTLKLERSPIETAEDFGNLLTSLIEDSLTGISVRAAYHSGRRQGLTGRALWEFASEGGSKTQSMYNLEDLPGFLRAREAGAIAPFQTFAFEVMNTVRELDLPGLGRIGMYKTTQNRLLSITRWVAAMAVVNAAVDKAINRKPWVLSSFIPFWGLMTGGFTAGNPWNYALPVKYTHDFWEGLGDYMKYGNWKRLRTWAIQYHMLGGTQMNRTLKGIEAVADGKVEDVAGRTLFDVSDDQAWKVVTQGPYASSEGQEYIDELQRSKGPLYEYTGIPLPELANAYEREWRGTVREYNGLKTTKARNAYRDAHPEEEAQLFILGRFTYLRSRTAERHVRRLMQEFGIPPEDVRGYENVFGSTQPPSTQDPASQQRVPYPTPLPTLTPQEIADKVMRENP